MERGTGTERVKTPRSLLTSLRFGWFSRVNAPGMDASLRLLSGVPETLILTLCAGFLDGVFGEHDSEPFKEKRDRAVRGSISLPPARTGPPRRRPRSQHTPTRFGPSRRSINTCALNEQTGGLKGRVSVTERGGGGGVASAPSCLLVLFAFPFLLLSCKRPWRGRGQ